MCVLTSHEPSKATGNCSRYLSGLGMVLGNCRADLNINPIVASFISAFGITKTKFDGLKAFVVCAWSALVLFLVM